MRYSIYVFIILAVLTLGMKFADADSRDIERLIVSKDYIQAINLCTERLKQGRNQETEETLFFLAEALVYSGSTEHARTVFQTLLSKYPATPYLERLLLRTADSWYMEYDYVRARDAYLDFLQKFPRSGYLPYVYLKLVYASEKLGEWENKRTYLSMLESKYPSTIEASMIPEIERRGYEFTVQVGAYGDRHNAIRISRQLKNDGFPVYVYRDEGDPDALYKVVVGKFKDLHNADKLVEKLKTSGFPARRYP